MPKFTSAPDFREMQWKEPKGPWYARKRKGDKWLCKSTKLKNKAHARQAVMKILAEWGSQPNSPHNLQKVELFCDASTRYQDSKVSSSKPTQNSVFYARKHLDGFFGRFRIEDITENHWLGRDGYLVHRRNQSPDAALFNEWKTFIGTMNLMHREGHRTRKLSVPNPDGRRDSKDVIWADSQLDLLFDKANETLALQMAMAHDIFLPKKEILNAEWARFDLRVGTNAFGQLTFGSFFIPGSKTKGRPDRYVPLPREIRDELDRRKHVQNARFTREYGKKSPFVFPTRGNPDQHVLDNRGAFTRLKLSCGLGDHDGTFYTMRHTGLTRAYSQSQKDAGLEGKDISVGAVKIAIVAGHSIETAIRRYLKLKPDQLASVTNLTGSFGGLRLRSAKTSAENESTVGTSGMGLRAKTFRWGQSKSQSWRATQLKPPSAVT